MRAVYEATPFQTAAAVLIFAVGGWVGGVLGQSGREAGVDLSGTFSSFGVEEPGAEGACANQPSLHPCTGNLCKRSGRDPIWSGNREGHFLSRDGNTTALERICMRRRKFLVWRRRSFASRRMTAEGRH